MIWYNVIRFAIKYRAALAAGLALIGIVGTVWYIDSQAYDRGYEARKREDDTALQQLREKQLFELSKMEKGYDSASKKVRAISGGCVGPASAYSIEWLREHRRDPE